MSSNFIPSLLVPIVGLLTPFLIVFFFLRYADRDVVN